MTLLSVESQIWYITGAGGKERIEKKKNKTKHRDNQFQTFPNIGAVLAAFQNHLGSLIKINSRLPSWGLGFTRLSKGQVL